MRIDSRPNSQQQKNIYFLIFLFAFYLGPSSKVRSKCTLLSKVKIIIKIIKTIGTKICGGYFICLKVTHVYKSLLVSF